jgi:ATP-dependent Clp protease ATP-binding subunit ClpX
LSAPTSASLDSLTWRLWDSTSTVVGQDDARRRLANVLRRQHVIASGEELAGAGVLVAGQTGSGKTYTVSRMCQACGLPFAETNATRYTESGYHGLDLPQMYLPLVYAASEQLDLEIRYEAIKAGEQFEDRSEKSSPLERPSEQKKMLAEMVGTGVILLDEFDKWFGEKDPMGRDKGRSLQAELLRLLEGDTIWVNDNDGELGIQIDTSKILVIACGAFVGLERSAASRINHDDPGSVNRTTAWENIEPADLIKFGMLPELAGRLTTHIMLKPLSEKSLEVIVPSFLKEYEQRFKDEGVTLIIDDRCRIEIARQAIGLKIGARALRFILERLFDHALFEAGMGKRGKIVLTHEMVKSRRAVIDDSGS